MSRGSNMRVAMLAVHTSPLEQPGTGDAGGMNVYVSELAAALARQGADVEIFTRRTASSQPEVVELSSAADTAGSVLVRHLAAGPFEGLDKADLPAQMCYFSAGVLRTAARMPPRWYDVVHSHYWLSGQSGWLAADRWGVPLVHTMHTMAVVKNAHLAAGDTPEPLSRIVGEGQVVEESDALVASTDQERDDLVTAYGADPERVVVVPPGVDLKTFHPGSPDSDRAELRTRLGVEPHRPLVVFAGRLQLLKGPDVLIRALGELRRRGRGRLPRLVLLGGPSGRPSARDELRALAWQEDVAHEVTFLDPVARVGLAEWLRAADVVAVPSHSESFGLVALEAQAVGTPVVAAAVGGLQTAVADGVSGVLVHSHEPQAWADALASLLSDAPQWSRLSTGARQHAERFTWDAAADRLLTVYRDAHRTTARCASS